MNVPLSPNLVRDGKLDRQAVEAGLRRCLDTVLRAGRFDLRYDVDWQEAATPDGLDSPEVIVNFDGGARELLLEHGGELLKAFEYIAVRWLRLDPKLHDRVRFDCGNYRADKLAELKLSAKVAATRVFETHIPFRFNPMGARERRIIHLVLKDQPGIRTASEGVGDERQVVIFPAT
jgi:spoIIIJ-associated protein